MAQKLQGIWRRVERDPVMDVLGGVWLVTLLASLLHLPLLVA